MNKLTAGLLLLLLTGCGPQKSLSGKELSAAESTALETCNTALQSGVGVTLDEVKSTEANFTHDKDEISVTWQFPSGGGMMAHVCTTRNDGVSLVAEANLAM